MKTRRVILAFLPLLPSLVLAGPSAPSRDSGWWSAAERNAAESEYRIGWQEGTAQAPNRAQGFRTAFPGDGVRVVPRVAADGRWAWTFRLVRWGRDGAMREPETPRMSVRESEMEYDRGALVERFRNGPRGLEETLRIDAPPESVASRELDPVRLDFASSGELSPAVTTETRSIDLTTRDGRKVLRWQAVEVVDAAGRSLPLWIEGASVLFDDAGALYPIEVEMVTTSASWIVESDQSSSRFGGSVASGDVNHDGYDDVVVGAEQFDNGETDEGRAFLYLGSPTGLATTPAWTAESNQSSGRFGCAVAAGDVNGDGFADVVVGAYFANSLTGGAYLYLGSATGLATAPAWITTSTSVSSFGFSVATGDVNGDGFADVVVGARNFSSKGRIFVFFGGPFGPPTVANWFADPDVSGATALGASVATADVNGDGFDDVIAGAPSTTSPLTSQGKAYLYLGSASGPSATPSWSVLGDQTTGTFGHSVASAGDVNGDGFDDVVVGSDGRDTNLGRAYLYLGSASGLSTTAAWSVNSGSLTPTSFGSSVASAGDVNRDGFDDVVIGAFLYDSGGQDAGGIFVYLGSSSGPATTPAWTATGGAQFVELGSSVTHGDVNGDGFSDVVAGAIGYGNVQSTEGAAFAYYGSCSPSPEICDGLDNDCNGTVDDVPAPTGSPSLTETPSGPDLELSWTAVAGATAYDVVRGDLASLRSAGGDFTPAIDQCVANDLAATSIVATGAPAAGDAFFFLVRPVNCGGKGSYGSGATVDAEIDAAATACP